MDDDLGSGRLEEQQFAALAGRIFREGRSGELSLVSGHRRRCVWFLGGNPVAVVSDSPQDHVAQFLLEHGRIDTYGARRLALLPETRSGVGSVEFLAKEALNWGVKFRFVNLCYDLFRWQEGEYAFREGIPPKNLFLLKVPAHSLIFKGIEHLDTAVVVAAVPDASVFLPGPVSAAEARYLGPDERRLLDECRPGRTVAAVLGDAGEDEERFRRRIYAFVCLGLMVLAREPDIATAVGQEAGDHQAGGAKFELAESEESAAASPDDSTTAVGEPVEMPQSTPPPTYFSAAPAPEPPPFTFASRETVSEAVPANESRFAGAVTSLPASVPQVGTEPPIAVPPSAPGSPSERYITVAGRRSTPRLVGIAAGALAALAIIGAVSWWMGSDQATPPDPPAPSRQPVPAQTSPQPAPAPAPPPPPAGQVPALKSGSPAPSPDGDRYRRGLEAFRAGDLSGSAAIWEALLAEDRRDGFTIQLQTACQPQSIRKVQRALDPTEIFLVGKKVNGRDCYRVCVGRFGSRESAAASLAGLPGEFRSSGAMVRAIRDVLAKDR